MALYVTDTHPLIWYATQTYGKLSRRALQAFEKANRSEALIYVPAMVLWEAGLLEKIGRVRFIPSFPAWMDALLALPGFALAELNVDVISTALSMTFNSDPFDLAIVSTARMKELPLITKDLAITKSRLVDIVW